MQLDTRNLAPPTGRPFMRLRWPGVRRSHPLL